jgi:hypothetical protein
MIFRTFAEIRAFATDDQIIRAAIAWCGAKDRETFPEDVTYFKCNWWSMPGLLARIIQEVKNDAEKQDRNHE